MKIDVFSNRSVSRLNVSEQPVYNLILNLLNKVLVRTFKVFKIFIELFDSALEFFMLGMMVVEIRISGLDRKSTRLNSSHP